ncbi:MAG: hypothetical protein Hyperionvirus4_155 [Hyperionvirus sp.]|uniref:Uncharacterized protein n=1 Tax=Hyperionvirus sp. TaxID=2487770 RepID=A0A3G5A7E5_9VIRU|nr:MAG: hypothetical protein Hyperionvirus4_155 [Hyperionvirus sp.]
MQPYNQKYEAVTPLIERGVKIYWEQYMGTLTDEGVESIQVRTIWFYALFTTL